MSLVQAVDPQHIAHKLDGTAPEKPARNAKVAPIAQPSELSPTLLQRPMPLDETEQETASEA